MADLSFPSSTTRRGRVQENGEICPTLMAGQQDVCYIEDINNPLKGKTNYGWHFEQNVYAEESKCTRTIKAGGGSGNIPKVIKEFRIRKLIPLECWRLMGFTDEQFHKAEKVNSNSQLYKQAGNSIVVDVLYWLFYQLFINKCEHPVTEELDQLQGQMTIFDYLGGTL